MRWRIRSQLLLPVVLLLAGVAAISVTTAIAAADQARRQIETRLRTVARFLGEDSQFPLNDEVLRKLRLLSGAEYLLKPVSGRVQTSLPTAGELALAGPVADDWSEVRLGPPVRLGPDAYLCSGVRLRSGRWTNAGDTLYILYPESLWRDARLEAMRPSLVLGGCTGLVALLLALLQARDLGRRIRTVDHHTRLIAQGDFSPMPLPGRDDEVRDLVVSINDMARQLAQFRKTVETTERLRLLGQVSGGLAHQLRNGLTGARLAVQLFLHEAEPTLDTTALAVALRQLNLLETQVKRFLDLGRVSPSPRDLCSLTSLVTEAVELLLPRCQHTGTRLVWNPPIAPIAILGDAGQLTQVLVNLLDNAIDAAGPTGEVEVTLQQEPGLAVLCVFDTGPGPLASVCDRLFEPFVTGKPEGVGLGLAIARQVAERHLGRISWQRLQNRTCFRVELPAV